MASWVFWRSERIVKIAFGAFPAHNEAGIFTGIRWGEEACGAAGSGEELF